MNDHMIKITIIAITISLMGLIFANQMGFAAEGAGEEPNHKQGILHYQNNESEKAIPFFKEALAAAFLEPASGKLQQAINLAKNGKINEAEKIFRSLFDEKASAARSRYELGRVYEAQDKIEKAAMLYKNALTIISNKGAKYLGVKGCKKCHFKQYKSWKKTKMAKTFEVLKPGVNAEAKTRLKLDPKKDYTKDPYCLSCHTTGFGLPGGYHIPLKSDLKAKKIAKGNEGITCEACHGPGGIYVDVHENVKNSKRQYSQKEFFQAGMHKINAEVCTTCHNQRAPAAGPDYKFDYEKYKAGDIHKNFPLKYQVK